MINAKMTLDGARIERVQVPTLVSTGESLTRAELFVAFPEAANIDAYAYAGARATDRIYPLFHSNLVDCALKLRLVYSLSGTEQVVERTALSTLPLIGSVVEDINSVWADLANVRVRARNDGSRLVITAEPSAPNVNPIRLEVLNSAVAGRCSATEVWSHTLFRYFSPDPRAISRVGDVVPPPPRPHQFTTPISRGVAEGEDRTSASLNRGLELVSRELTERAHAQDLHTRRVALGFDAVNDSLVPEFDLSPEIPPGEGIALVGTAVSHPDSEGTLLFFKGARWLIEVDTPWALVENASFGEAALSSTPHTQDRDGSHTYFNATHADWHVHYGPTIVGITTLVADNSRRLLSSVACKGNLACRMVDSETIEFLNPLDPFEQITEAVLKDSAGAGCYVVEWLGPYRAIIAPLKGASPHRTAAGIRAGVDAELVFDGNGNIDLHRGPYVDPHEYVAASVPGYYVTPSMTDGLTLTSYVTHVHPVYQDALGEVPTSILPFDAHVALLQRHGPYGESARPRVHDDALLQSTRWGLDQAQRIVQPIGPLDPARTLSGFAGEEGRSVPTSATVRGATTTTFLPPPPGSINDPYIGVPNPNLDKIVYSIFSGTAYAGINDEDVSAHIAQTEPSELERQRAIARRYTRITVTSVDVYPALSRLVSEEGLFTTETAGRTAFIPAVGVVAITSVFSPRHAEFEVLDAITKDNPYVRPPILNTQVHIVPDAVGSHRDPQFNSPPTASRYWANNTNADYQIDIVADKQLIAGERLHSGYNAQFVLKPAELVPGVGAGNIGSIGGIGSIDLGDLDLSDIIINAIPYVVFAIPSGINDENVASLTGDLVAHIDYLYGEMYTGTVAGQLFDNDAQGTSDVSYRSPISYEFFVYDPVNDLFYRGRARADETIGLVNDGRIYALAFPLPRAFITLQEGPFTHASLYFRLNNVQLTASRRGVYGRMIAREAYVHGPVTVVGHDGGDENVQVVHSASEVSQIAQSTIFATDDTQQSSFCRFDARPQSARCVVSHSTDTLINTRAVTVCEADFASTHIADAAQQSIIEPAGLIVCMQDENREGQSTQALLSLGRPAFTETTALRTEEWSTTIRTELSALKEQVDRVHSMAALTVGAVSELNYWRYTLMTTEWHLARLRESRAAFSQALSRVTAGATGPVEDQSLDQAFITAANNFILWGYYGPFFGIPQYTRAAHDELLKKECSEAYTSWAATYLDPSDLINDVIDPLAYLDHRIPGVYNVAIHDKSSVRLNVDPHDIRHPDAFTYGDLVEVTNLARLSSSGTSVGVPPIARVQAGHFGSAYEVRTSWLEASPLSRGASIRVTEVSSAPTISTNNDGTYKFIGGINQAGSGIPVMPSYYFENIQNVNEIYFSTDLNNYLEDPAEDFVAPVFGYGFVKDFTNYSWSDVNVYRTTWIVPYESQQPNLEDSRRVYKIDQTNENLFKNRPNLSDQSKKLMYPETGGGELRFGDTRVLFFRSPFVNAPRRYSGNVAGYNLDAHEVGMDRFTLSSAGIQLRPIYYSGMIYAYDTAELADQAFTTADPALYERYTANSTGREFIKLTDLGLSEYAKTIEHLFWPLDRGLSTRVHSKYTRK